MGFGLALAGSLCLLLTAASSSQAAIPVNSVQRLPVHGLQQGSERGSNSSRRLRGVVGQGYALRSGSNSTHIIETGLIGQTPPPGSSCNQNLTVQSGLWQLFGVTCIQNGQTLQEQLTGPGELNAGLYQNGSAGWAVLRWNAGTQTYAYVGLNEILEEGAGYWLKSLHSGGALNLSLEGNVPVAGPFVHPAGLSGWNVYANPYGQALEWRSSSGITVEHGVVDNLLDAELAGAIRSTVYTWNGAGYQTHPAAGPISIPLPPGSGFWFRAFEPVTLTVPAPTRRRHHTPEGWSVQFVARSGALQSPVAWLGAFEGSRDGLDDNDIREKAPELDPFLTVTFTSSRDLQGDFRSLESMQGGAEWPFQIRTDRPDRTVKLAWQGPSSALQNARLIRLGTGEEIRPGDQNSWLLTLEGTSEAFLWSFEGLEDVPRVAAPVTGLFVFLLVGGGLVLRKKQDD